MKRVLIVTPHWPPLVYPDMHRARMALPYLAESGWQALVLSVNPAAQGGVEEPALVQTIPPETRQWQAGAIPRAWTTVLGIGHGGWRSLISLYRLGCKIIEKEKPELLFFSTTLFPAMILGPLWGKKYGVPYVLDYQDPWVFKRPSEPLSLGSVKTLLSRALDQRIEPYVLRKVAHIISVSPSYVKALSDRYPALRPENFTVLPFGAPENDFIYIQDKQVPQHVYAPQDGKRHWVYSGRGGRDLSLALRALFIALAEARRQTPAAWNNLRLHFIGTQYLPSQDAPKAIERLAGEYGVGDLVEEKTERIGYLESLRCLLDAEALIVPGSEDPGYTASKIYPCILARKPLLAIFHERSSVCDVLRKTGAGELVTFSNGESAEAIAARISKGWFDRWPVPTPPTDWNAFSEYSAREMTRRMCQAFDRTVVSRR